MENYGIEPEKWYSPNEIVEKGLLFGKSKRYVFDLINNKEIEATNTSSSSKPQWKILGRNLIEFIRGKSNESSNTSN